MNEFSFEAAYARLEQILQRISGGEISLEESLKLYEEADGLIVDCQKRLSAAEQKIETLVKNREGALQLEPFQRG